jgi:hypothetical protein
MRDMTHRFFAQASPLAIALAYTMHIIHTRTAENDRQMSDGYKKSDVSFSIVGAF